MVHFRPVSDRKGPSRGSEDIRYDDVCEEQQEVAGMEEEGRINNTTRV